MAENYKLNVIWHLRKNWKLNVAQKHIFVTHHCILNQQNNLLTGTKCAIQSLVHNVLQTFWFSIKIGLGPHSEELMDTSQRFLPLWWYAAFSAMKEREMRMEFLCYCSSFVAFADSVVWHNRVCKCLQKQWCGVLIFFFSLTLSSPVFYWLRNKSEKWNKRRNICQLWKNISAS